MADSNVYYGNFMDPTPTQKPSYMVAEGVHGVNLDFNNPAMTFYASANGMDWVGCEIPLSLNALKIVRETAFIPEARRQDMYFEVRAGAVYSVGISPGVVNQNYILLNPQADGRVRRVFAKQGLNLFCVRVTG